MTRTTHRPPARRWPLLALGILLAGCTAPGAGDDDPGGDEPTGTDTVAEARAAFDQVADRLAAGDAAGVREVSSGPAAAFFRHVDHLRRASAGAPEDVFPHLRAEPGEATESGSSVTFAGPISWGDAEGPPPRVLSDLVFRDSGAGWELERFSRNDVPVDRWVSPAAEDDPVRSGPVTGRVVGVFVDVTCLEGRDPGCPDLLTDALAVDLEITNDSGAPLVPGEVTLPDGGTAPAWLETPSGPRPLLDAITQGFPPGETGPVTALVGGVSDMAEGGTLHVALQTAEGTTHAVDLPVPAYPATW